MFYFGQTSVHNIQMFKIHIIRTILKKKNVKDSQRSNTLKNIFKPDFFYCFI